MQSSVRGHKPAKPLLGIGLIMGSLYLFLSLVTYFPNDPSWNYSTNQAKTISNWGGLVGSYLSDFFIHSFGMVIYALVIGTFFLGIRFLRPVSQGEVTANTKASRSRIPLAFSLFTFSTTGLLSLFPFKIYSEISLGGFVGHLISSAGVFFFSPIGATLLFVAGLWSAGYLLTNRVSFVSFSLDLRKSRESLSEAFMRLKSKFREKMANLFVRKVKIDEPQTALKAKLEDLFKKPSATAMPSPSETTSNEKSSLFSLFQKSPGTSEPSDRVLLVHEAPARTKSRDPKEPFELPSLQLLDLPVESSVEISKDELIANSRALEQKLLDFGVQGHVTSIRPGPIITLYEFEPAAGVKVKNIVNLTDDLKLAMKAVSVRILAPIPGRAAVGIEIPNPRRQTVYLREILQSNLFQNSSSLLTLGMGKTTSGEAYVTDLSKMPHLLIAGATGSGKSVGLNAMVVSLLYKATPQELQFIMIDPKMLELSVYDGIPHLLLPVVTDPKKAARALAWAVKEMERRYKLISSLGARNLKSYNEKVSRMSEDELMQTIEKTAQTEAQSSFIMDHDFEEEKEQQELALHEAGLNHYVQLPQIVVVIDELADLIMVAARDVEESIARLAQMARAAGIHLIIATQRPSVDVITGVIKANLPTRCAFQVASKVDSRTILDISGAENLIGDGDMLFLPPGTSRLERLHGPFISEDEISRIVKHLKSQARADYSTSIDLDEPNNEMSSPDEDFDDQLYDQAIQVVFETKSPSASMIQRRLRVGYNRAARMIEKMERDGIVSAPLGSGKGRELLVQAPES